MVRVAPQLLTLLISEVLMTGIHFRNEDLAGMSEEDLKSLYKNLRYLVAQSEHNNEDMT